MTDALAKASPQETQIVNMMLTEGLDPSKVASQLDMSLQAVLEVLQREHVRRALGIGMLTEKRERFKEIRDGVVQALWQLASYDVADLVDETGRMHADLRKIPPQLRCAIKGYKMGRYGAEYTFVDRAAILTTLANIFAKAGDADTGDAKDRTVLVIHE